MIIKCPHCGGELEVPPELAGRKGRCESCGKSFLIAPRSPAPKPAPASVPKPAAPRPTGGRSVALIVTILIIAAGVGLFFALRGHSASSAPEARPPAAAPAEQKPSPVPSVAGVEGPAFSMADWKAKQGAAIPFAKWREADPFPWGVYFDANSEECARSWFFQLGPLGVKVGWRDASPLWMSFPGFAALYPAALKEGSLGTVNAIEVLAVRPDGPAAGHLQPGDLIISIDGQAIRSSEDTVLDRELAARDARGLEIHAGRLVDAAEGRGRISLGVLRLPAKPAAPVGRSATLWSLTSSDSFTTNLALDVRGAGAVTLSAQTSGGGNGNCWVNWIEPELIGATERVDLSAARPLRASTGWGKLARGYQADGSPVRRAGAVAPASMGAHANSQITYAVPPGVDQLRVTVNAPHGNAGIRYEIIRHTLTPYEGWVPDAVLTATNRTADLRVAGGSVLSLVGRGTGSVRLAAVSLRDVTTGASIDWKKSTPVFSTLEKTPDLGAASIELPAPFQLEYLLPPGNWHLTSEVAGLDAGIESLSIGHVSPPRLPPSVAGGLTTVEFDVPRIGSYGGHLDLEGEKIGNVRAMMAERLAAQQRADGSWETVPGSYSEPMFHGSMALLGLMSTGDARYDDAIRRGGRWIAATPDKLGNTDWCYPQGVRVLALSEYYLRTHDDAVLPSLQRLVDFCCRDCLTYDYVAGHKVGTPGYGGGGWIGASGTIALGLVAASHTPVKLDPKVLESLLNRIQELSLANGGNLPYGRGLGRVKEPASSENLSRSKAWCSGNGSAVIASVMGGGGALYVDYSRARFTSPPWGDEDGGHASHTLPFVWSTLASAIFGPESLRQSLEANAWRITLMRDFTGFINNNTSRLEYRGAEGVIGKPYWSTGGILLCLNAHRRNLLCTGASAYARRPRQLPYAQAMDRRFLQATLNDWNLVEAVLGSRTPASFASVLKQIRALRAEDTELGPRLLGILQSSAPTVARQILALPELSPVAKGWCAELVLGVRDQTTEGGRYFEPVGATGKYLYSPRLQTPAQAWGLASSSPNADWQGSVVLSDPAGRFPPRPVTIALEPGKALRAADVMMPTNGYRVRADYQYTVAGVPIRYTRDLEVNPTNDVLRGRGLWVRGRLPQVQDLLGHWRLPIQLPTGQMLEATRREARTIFVRNAEGVMPLRRKEDLPAGDNEWFEFLVPGAWALGETPVYEIRKMRVP